MLAWARTLAAGSAGTTLILVLVDDDAVKQGSIEDAAFSGFALVVETAEVGEQVANLVATVSALVYVAVVVSRHLVI
ncbi:hypothetical protein AYJ66_13760 [Dietzia cinnamea]|nr:hypothetical protein AYJ66_13760 [Dietzia cinnamea]